MRANKRHEVTENEIQAFNWMRESMVGKEMNPEGLREQLKKLQYKPNGNFILAITSGENPPIIRVSRGKYVFNPKPVYIDRMKKVWKDYADYGNKKSENKSDKPVIIHKSFKLLTGVTDENVLSAINLLKEKGYKIYRPKVEYEEI